MKISKSKQELSRIIMENCGWRDGAEFAAQEKSGLICFYKDKPTFGPSYWHGKQLNEPAITAIKIKNWNKTSLSEIEFYDVYEHDIRLRMRGLFAKPKFCESVTRQIPEPEQKQTIEQLAADYRNANDYAGRKQVQADNAKADANAKLKALELACEALGFLVSPIATKQQAELVIADWRDLQVGDEVSVQHMKNVYSNSEVMAVGNSEVSIRNHSGARKTVNLDEVDWKFIRRP